jgi:large subunit ribosomal protein L19
MKARSLTKETISQLGIRETNFPEFKVGDTIAVSLRIIEGNKERVQTFEGDVISVRNNGASSTFTVRKMGAHGIAVERIIPFHSPKLELIKVVKRGVVRRAKLYYLRKRVGNHARIEEKVVAREQKKIAAVHADVAGSLAE